MSAIKKSKNKSKKENLPVGEPPVFAVTFMASEKGSLEGLTILSSLYHVLGEYDKCEELLNKAQVIKEYEEATIT